MQKNLKKKTRAALYARVSTTQHNQNVGLQLEELRRVGEQRGWSVVEEFVDEGFSGTVKDRPALDAMLDKARKGKLDIVVVWKLDRLGRSLQHLIQILEELNHLGVGFISLTDGLDTSTTNAQSTLMVHILGAFAAYEAAMIRERVQAGVDRARAHGKTLGRPRRELDLRAARVLLEQGHSVREVADMLGLPRTTLRRRLREAGRGGPESPSEVAA